MGLPNRPLTTGLKINQKLPWKSNNVDFLRYCGGHFENGDR